jgi:drug/metabolite transporter (DMT)-like permease
VKPVAGQSSSAVALSLARVLIVAAGMIAIKVGVKHCPPLTLATMRLVCALPLAYVAARVSGATWPRDRAGWWRMALIGLLQVGLPSAFLNLSLHHASAGTASIVYATQPLALALAASRLLNERLTRARTFGLLLGFGGVVLVMVARVGAGGREDTPLGVVLLGLSVISLTASTILFKRTPTSESPLAVVAIQYAVSAFVLFAALLFVEPPWRTHVVLSTELVVAFVYLLLFPTILGQVIWQVMLAKGEASVLTSYFFLTPIFGLILATLFLHESFSVRDAIGLLAVVVGITLVARTPARPTPAPRVLPETEPARTEIR